MPSSKNGRANDWPGGRKVDCQMTADKILEKALIGKNIFPPSVLDSRYGEHARMAKEQVIEKIVESLR